MEPVLIEGMRGSALVLGAALALDLVLGDPRYRFHPIRLMGGMLAAGERALRRLGFDGRFGGMVLSMGLAALCLGIYFAASLSLEKLHPWAAVAFEVYVVYSLLALGDLLRHVRRVALAKDDSQARFELAKLVGRDVEPLDAQACRRAALESLAESVLDGVWSPLFWYALLGIPGLILFKVASTLDSMVGYKNERYLRFGWFGARWDDWMNWLPARISWLTLSLTAFFLPGFSGLYAFKTGWKQHGLLPSPNSGWPEATMAGALRLRLVGPVYKAGKQITDLWIGNRGDPPGASARDIAHGIFLVCAGTLWWLLPFLFPRYWAH